MTRVLLCLAVSLLLAGCWAGTWTDDPHNWSRAFHEDASAPGIRILRSWYTRTPHFTAEYAWCFELELSPERKMQILEQKDFPKVASLSDRWVHDRLGYGFPSWCPPKPLSEYDAYEAKDDPGFVILVQKSGLRSYWFKCHY
jgi:hypothetical protein